MDLSSWFNNFSNEIILKFSEIWVIQNYFWLVTPSQKWWYQSEFWIIHVVMVYCSFIDKTSL